jgi:hypothetical protein
MFCLVCSSGTTPEYWILPPELVTESRELRAWGCVPTGAVGDAVVGGVYAIRSGSCLQARYTRKPSSGSARNGNNLKKVDPPVSALRTGSPGCLTASVLIGSPLAASGLAVAPPRYEFTQAGSREGTTPSGVRRSTTLGMMKANAEAAAARGMLTLDAMRFTVSPPIALSSCSVVTGVFEPRLTQDETISPRPARLN